MNCRKDDVTGHWILTGPDLDEIGTTLIPGKHYMVLVRGGIFVRRAFLYHEMRFGTIDCFVFTTKISSNLKVTVENQTEDTMTITYSGTKRTPAKELSAPVYDIMLIISTEIWGKI